jgi:RimJ/RimL family protein N-acetyltransferase
MNLDKEIFGQDIYLRVLLPTDASKEYCDWLNDSEINQFLETRQTTIADLQNYIKKQLNDSNSLFFGIFDKTNHTHLGNLKLEPIDWPKKKAVFGIMIGNKNYLGKGLGTQATKLIVDFAFNHLGLEEIELGVISENKRAQRAFEKSGFIKRRVQPQALDHDGVLYDKIIMSIKKNN